MHNFWSFSIATKISPVIYTASTAVASTMSVHEGWVPPHRYVCIGPGQWDYSHFVFMDAERIKQLLSALYVVSPWDHSCPPPLLYMGSLYEQKVYLFIHCNYIVLAKTDWMKTKVSSPPSLSVYCTYRTVAVKGAATADNSYITFVTVSILASKVLLYSSP